MRDVTITISHLRNDICHYVSTLLISFFIAFMSHNLFVQMSEIPSSNKIQEKMNFLTCLNSSHSVSTYTHIAIEMGYLVVV